MKHFVLLSKVPISSFFALHATQDGSKKVATIVGSYKATMFPQSKLVGLFH
jgi:hypothetical protein